MLCAVILIVASTWIAWNTAPGAPEAHTAHALGIDLQDRRDRSVRGRPGEWLQYSAAGGAVHRGVGGGVSRARICGQRVRRGDLESQHLQFAVHRRGAGAAVAATTLCRCGGAQRARYG